MIWNIGGEDACELRGIYNLESYYANTCNQNDNQQDCDAKQYCSWNTSTNTCNEKSGANMKIAGCLNNPKGACSFMKQVQILVKVVV